MKYITADYMASMAQAIRERSYISISVASINEAAVEDGTWVSNGNATYAYLSSGKLDNPHLNYQQTTATLELNRWVLDGTQTILEDSSTYANDGYVSSYISDVNGNFSTAPVLRRPFSDTHDLEGFTIGFDTVVDEWPIDASIVFKNGNTVVYTWNISSADSPRDILLHDLQGIDSIAITGNALLPYRRFRVQLTALGLSERWGNSDITGVTKVDDIDPISRRLPDQTVTFSLIDYDGRYDPENPSGISEYLQTKSTVTVGFGYDVNGDGNIEWLQPDWYYLESMPVWHNGIATFTATKRLGIMTDLYRRGNYGNKMPSSGALPLDKTLYNMADDILKDAGLTSEDYIIDYALLDVYCSGIMPVVTHAEAIQMVAHAGCCRLYCDSSDVIHVEKIAVSDYANNRLDFMIDNTSITEKSLALEKTDQCKSVSVNIYQATPENIFTSDIEVGTLDNDGQPANQTNRLRTVSYIPVSPGHYTMSVTASGTLWCWVDIYDESFNYISAESSTAWIQNNDATFDVTRKGYVKFVWRNSAESTMYTTDIYTTTLYGVNELLRSGYSNASGSSSIIIEQGSLYVATGEEFPASNVIRSKAAVFNPGLYTVSSSKRMSARVYNLDGTYISGESVNTWQTPTMTLNITTTRKVRLVFSNSDDSDLTPSDLTDLVITGGTSGTTDIIGNIFEFDSPYGEYYTIPNNATLTPNPYLFARYCNFQYNQFIIPTLINVYGMPVYEDVNATITQTVEGKGNEDIEDNVLITDNSMATALQTQVADYLTLRDTYTLDYRGNPELEAGDVIGIQTRYTPDRDVLVLRHEITFNGALRGNLTVKGL